MSLVLATHRPEVIRVEPSMKNFGWLVLAVAALGAVGCDKRSEGPSPFTNELKAGPAPLGGVVSRGGKTDDGIKPVGGPAGTVSRVGTFDDGVRPAPGGTLTRGGQNDDGITPLPGGPAHRRAKP